MLAANTTAVLNTVAEEKCFSLELTSGESSLPFHIPTWTNYYLEAEVLFKPAAWYCLGTLWLIKNQLKSGLLNRVKGLR